MNACSFELLGRRLLSVLRRAFVAIVVVVVVVVVIISEHSEGPRDEGLASEFFALADVDVVNDFYNGLNIFCFQKSSLILVEYIKHN